MRQRQNVKLDRESQHARPYDSMNRMMLITILIVTNAAITGASSEIILRGSKNGPVSSGQKQSTSSLSLSTSQSPQLTINMTLLKKITTIISGLIGELVTGRADLIVAPLTINPERAQVPCC